MTLEPKVPFYWLLAANDLERMREGNLRGNRVWRSGGWTGFQMWPKRELASVRSKASDHEKSNDDDVMKICKCTLLFMHERATGKSRSIKGRTGTIPPRSEEHACARFLAEEWQ